MRFIPQASYRRGAMVVSLALVLLFMLPFTLNLTADMSEQLLKYHIDIDVYREGARSLLAGENIYTRDFQVGGIMLPFTYPPLAAMLFTPLVLLPVYIDAVILNGLTLLALWWCMVIVLGAATRLPLSDRRLLALMVLPVAIVCDPVRETLGFAQVNVLLMALVIADTLRPRSRVPRGLFIGLAAAIKLTPAVFGLFFLLKRDWRSAIQTAVFGVGFTALAWLIRPDVSKEYWFNTLRDPSRIGGLAYSTNQSFRGLFARLFPGDEDLQQTLWKVAVVVTIGAASFGMVRLLRAGNAVGALLVNSFVAALCSPVSWTHHWTWLIPFVLLLVVSAFQPGSGRVRGIAGGFAVIIFSTMIVVPFFVLPHANDREIDWPLSSQVIGSAYVFIAIALLITACTCPAVFGRGADVPARPELFFTTNDVASRVASRAFAVCTWLLVVCLLLLVLIESDGPDNSFTVAYQTWFQQFLGASQRVFAGLPVYGGYIEHDFVHYVYTVTPAGTFMLGVLALLGETAATVVWTAVSVASLVLAAYALQRGVINSSEPVINTSVGFITAMMLTLIPVLNAVNDGHIVLLVLAATISDIYLLRTSRFGGIATGVVAAMAAWPAVLIIVLPTWASKMRAAMVAGFATIIALAIDPQLTRDWIRALALPMDNANTLIGAGAMVAFVLLAVLLRNNATLRPLVLLGLPMALFGGFAAWPALLTLWAPLAIVGVLMLVRFLVEASTTPATTEALAQPSDHIQ
ncbi:glycosyltransferase 87 family protein [Corynebacterium argentoratense]|uniref:glycosyltransferase 87 family protein n=1 Tax=Corynebacterium argentoratense TaxID=42817 RepID=UPI001F2C27DB|nr:glycosyltransferase 87 family protein [Corynebacterium argentoratense]MCF1765041.1 glycosyltransferase 87 family protein [Corynebacterium argentoratense]